MDVRTEKKLLHQKIRKENISVEVLDFATETPLYSLNNFIIDGSLSVDGESIVRTGGSLSIALKTSDEYFKQVQILLNESSLKKIKIKKGVVFNNKNVWWDLGIFVIKSITPEISADGTKTYSLELSDKMCLLDGSVSGKLPAVITFDSYDEYFNGEVVTKKTKISDIIKTLVVEYGKETLSNLVIDVEPRIKTVMRYEGDSVLYFDKITGRFTRNEGEIDDDWTPIEKGDNVGYCFTDFVYPKELTSSIGSSITDILEEIRDTLGNYEFFYDTKGKFIFREKKNCLNSSFSFEKKDGMGETNAFLDFSTMNNDVISFSENEDMVLSLVKTPQTDSISNDIHIYGQKNKEASKPDLHYHILIKEKPLISTRKVKFDGDIPKLDPNGISYTPLDWRCEEYFRGLEEIENNNRPNRLQQELLDLLPDIYDFKNNKYKVDIEKNPYGLSYFVDVIEPSSDLRKFSVDAVGERTYSEYDERINQIFELPIPDLILLDMDDSNYYEMKEECQKKGEKFSNVTKNIFKDFCIGTTIMSADSKMKSIITDLLSESDCVEAEIIPVYSLEPNSRVEVKSEKIMAYGDYNVDSFTVPLGIGTMSVSLSKIKTRF